jgi:HK97 gp10 family phage protein
LRDNFTVGFEGIGKQLSDLISKIDNKEDAIESVANDFASDIRRMPRPRSKCRSRGYTHLIDTVSYRKKGDVFQVGWGKYYGHMVESGTFRMNGSPHMRPTWQQNREKYIDSLKRKFGLN